MIRKLAPNVAEKITVKYVDAVPPNDAKYGPQARIKTDTGDVLYLPGKAADAFTQLVQAGVIVAPPATLPTIPGDKMVSVPMTQGVKEIVVTLEQAAGEKYGTLRISGTNGGNGTPPIAQAAYDRAGSVQPLPTGAAPAIPSALPQSPNGALAPYDNPLYLSIVAFVWEEVRPNLGQLVSPESFAAMVNTLFIQESRR